ncbi:hypothetical protein TOT_030000685 [Theileria orientalis strain Shintoku]|uniref:Uncharacterized protein n=1 Tax=Theileria orientalis strain Shintoku TaxID=869250 RepID=J4DPW7_THEOR|nr:hypothetical protein TOT_030000685 [Theileria orientalis strain Shintoku]BAM41424.1 hypothetical protein TOT_030000685 [Theileria orientalis strain Shintoku]|eukprot:XP_009691725.1 hypothetical protein TOT_030000685 [Theileria orientalis strain Shintoku]
MKYFRYEDRVPDLLMDIAAAERIPYWRILRFISMDKNAVQFIRKLNKHSLKTMTYAMGINFTGCIYNLTVFGVTRSTIHHDRSGVILWAVSQYTRTSSGYKHQNTYSLNILRFLTRLVSIQVPHLHKLVCF